MRLLLVLACLMGWGGARHALALEALEPAAASPQPVEPAYETPPETAMDFSQTIEPLPGPAAGPVLLDPPYEGWQDDFYEQPWRSGGRVATGFPEQLDDLWAPRPWSWQLMPNNLIYTSYLAGPKEPRLGTVWYDDTAPSLTEPGQAEGWLWDSTLGGRASILRYGSDTVLHPQGFEVQI